jgi:hypothetical protein
VVSLFFYLLLPGKGYALKPSGLLIGLLVGCLLLVIRLQGAWTAPIERMPRLDAPARPHAAWPWVLAAVVTVLGIPLLLLIALIAFRLAMSAANTAAVRRQAAAVEQVKEVETRPPSKGEADQLRFQLQYAQSHLARVQALYDRRDASQSELEAAQFAKDLAEAELKGDAVVRAALKLQHAEREFKRAEELYKQNLVSQDEYEKAKLARDTAAAEYSKLAPKSPPEPAPAAGAGVSKP